MPDLGNGSVFSQTDASNNSGTMPSWSGSAAPSTLDDAGRAFQGAVTREWNWRNVTVTSSGADTKTLTYSVAPAAYYNGQRFAFINGTVNTTTVTLNVNSLGAKSIRKMIAGTATVLAAGDMVAGSYVEVAYNTVGDYFVWLNGAGVTPQFTSIELGNASDTTITRSAAGVLAVEGGVIPKENRANTFSAAQTIAMGASQALLTMDANAAVSKTILMTTAASNRWLLSSENTAESGSNAGSNFVINRYSDAGSYLGTPITVNRASGLTTLESLAISGNARISGSGGLGYTTGSGGTVTQITSKATNVTLDKTNGQIITSNSNLTASTVTTFTLNNSNIAATDTVIVHRASGGTGGSYLVWCDGVGAGTATIAIQNITGGALAQALTLNFAIIKAVTS
jgi:hypothetical protein